MGLATAIKDSLVNISMQPSLYDLMHLAKQVDRRHRERCQEVISAASVPSPVLVPNPQQIAPRPLEEPMQIGFTRLSPEEKGCRCANGLKYV